MYAWIRHLDRLLRGEATSLPELRREQLDIPVLGICVVISILGMIYGACMGLFAITGTGSGSALQIPASMIKVPLLFFLTLLVTFPSLYVFNALVGSRLTFMAMVRLLIGSLAIMLAVLASMGPIVAFFSISTTSYSFILLLNVAIYTLAGFLGLAFLLQTLHRISVAQGLTEESAEPILVEPSYEDSPADPNTSEPPALPMSRQPGALERLRGHVLGPHVKAIFRIWLILFCIVGAQMAWVLRPFVGQPGKEFTFFRARESNFFETVWRLFWGLFGSGSGW